MAFGAFLLRSDPNTGARYALQPCHYWGCSRRTRRGSCSGGGAGHLRAHCLSALLGLFERSRRRTGRASASLRFWGQGPLELRTFMQDEGIGRVNLSYFGSARTGAYGIEYVALPILFRLSVPRICFAAEYPWLTVISAKGPGVGSVRAVPGERALRRDRAFSLRVR
jgi:hypothetical protein